MRFKQVLHNTPISSSHHSGFLTGKAVAAEVKKLLQPQRCCSQQGNSSLRVRNSGRRGSTSDGKPPFLVWTENPHSSFVLSSPAGLSSRSASPLSLQSLQSLLAWSTVGRRNGEELLQRLFSSPTVLGLHFLPARLFLGPTSSLSLYFPHTTLIFLFPRKALRFFTALGVSRLHLVAILVGENRRDFAFLQRVRAFQLVTLCFLALL